MAKKTKITGWPVMPAMCATCPFNDPRGELAIAVMNRVGLSASQICHHPNLTGKKSTHLCRGARDFQLMLLHRLHMIPEPTDAAFAAVSERVLKGAK